MRAVEITGCRHRGRPLEGETADTETRGVYILHITEMFVVGYF